MESAQMGRSKYDEAVCPSVPEQMWETQCDHFSVAWAISYRDYYGYYPSYIAGPVLNSHGTGTHSCGQKALQLFPLGA